jgi:hypothetical protein
MDDGLLTQTSESICFSMAAVSSGDATWPTFELSGLAMFAELEGYSTFANRYSSVVNN